MTVGLLLIKDRSIKIECKKKLGTSSSTEIDSNLFCYLEKSKENIYFASGKV